jgi:signal transduction histidine kinase
VEQHGLKELVSLLERRNQLLVEKERELADRQEELMAQKEELTAAIEQLQERNSSLTDALTELKVKKHELDQILYQSSHHLRTPVKSLEGLLNLLFSEGLSPSQKTLHAHMQDKVQQMNGLLTSLSNLSRAEFNSIEYTKVDFNVMVKLVVEELSMLPNYANIKFQSAGQNIDLTTDATLLKIILKSIIANAITFRDPLRTGHVFVDCVKANEKNCITIADDGEGIDPSIADNIFNMFFQGSQRSIGSGLGLYIVKSCLKRLGGNVSFESSPSGTQFKITLPAM